MSCFLLARVADSLLIDFNLHSLMPMMISRMIMSLRRVAASPQTLKSLDVPVGTPTGNSQDAHCLYPADNIKLSVVNNSTTGRSQVSAREVYPNRPFSSLEGGTLKVRSWAVSAGLEVSKTISHTYRIPSIVSVPFGNVYFRVLGK